MNLIPITFIFEAQKPRIEKLRRDRINGSLDEIKHLVLQALNKDVSFNLIQPSSKIRERNVETDTVT